MPQTLRDVLRTVPLYSDGERYVMLRLPPAAITAAAGVLAEIGEPFAALVLDKDEVTLILQADDLPDFAKRMPGHQVVTVEYRLITFDLVLEPTLTGFMAAVTQTLAAADVPILAVSAFSRDHVLVPAAQYEVAVAALETLKASFKES